MEEKPITVSPADPSRCQHVARGGTQCMYKATNDTQYCIFHGGAPRRKEELKNYRLTKWNARIAEKAESESIKSIREEIGILRMLLEERLDICKDSYDLILNSGPISDLVNNINTAVVNCHKLEAQMGNLLDRQAILQFANQVVTIISEIFANDPRVDEVAAKIIESLGEYNSDE